MLQKTIIILGTLITLGVMGIPALAGTCKLETTISKTGSCPTGSYFIGPLKAKEHWGTCLKAVNCESGLHIKTTYNRATCTESKRAVRKQRYVYAGANDANEHRGNCIMFKSNRIAVRAEEKRENKVCNTYGSGVYVGPNNVEEHWGTCLYVVKHGSFIIDNGTNVGAKRNSRIWSRVKADEEKHQKLLESAASRKPKSGDFVVFSHPWATDRMVQKYCSHYNNDEHKVVIMYMHNRTSKTLEVRMWKNHKGNETIKNVTLRPNGKRALGCNNTVDGRLSFTPTRIKDASGEVLYQAD